jgi:hypothetical protein
MTTIVPFTPSNITAPKFKALLDGNSYDIVVTWNLSAKRYYINIYGKGGVWILTVPIISTAPARKVSAAVYDPFLNAVTITLLNDLSWVLPTEPPCLLPTSGFMEETKVITNTKPGTIIEYTLDNFQPATYNGRYRSLHLNDQSFVIPMPVNPGPVVVLGQVSRLLSMISCRFTRSTMIYRNGAFEISP